MLFKKKAPGTVNVTRSDVSMISAPEINPLVDSNSTISENIGHVATDTCLPPIKTRTHSTESILIRKKSGPFEGNSFIQYLTAKKQTGDVSDIRNEFKTIRKLLESILQELKIANKKRKQSPLDALKKNKIFKNIFL